MYHLCILLLQKILVELLYKVKVNEVHIDFFVSGKYYKRKRLYLFLRISISFFVCF